jgi:ABC-2 type transport system permease protein
MKNQIQNRTYILLDLFNMFSRCFIVFLLYGYVFRLNDGIINGVNAETALWSMFIYFCIMTLNTRRIHRTIMDDIKSGNVEMFINKPVNYVLLSFYKTLGQGIYSFVVISIIGIIAMILFLGVPEVNPVIFIPTIIITLILGQTLGLIMYSIIGILSFFMHDIRPVYWITDKIVMVLGGSYLPIAFFPPFMKAIAYLSPFGAINFASSTVYDFWNTDFIIRIAMQVGWIILFGLILIYVFDKAKKKAMINGG